MLRFVTSAIFLRRHTATCLLSKGTMFSRLGICPKRVQNISHLDGYYSVSHSYRAFPYLYALQSFACGEVGLDADADVVVDTSGGRNTFGSVKVGAHAFNHATSDRPDTAAKARNRHCPSSRLQDSERPSLACLSFGVTLLFSHHPHL
jgi:hypothetical protein